MELRELTTDDREAFLDHLSVLDERLSGKYEGEFQSVLSRLKREKSDPPEGRVPMTVLFAFVDGVIVGSLRIRHYLNDSLRAHGGHIGYEVAPPYRGRGHAKHMLCLGLSMAKRICVDQPIMVTCDKDNVASRSVIEANGGKLVEEYISSDSGNSALRFHF